MTGIKNATEVMREMSDLVDKQIIKRSILIVSVFVVGLFLHVLVTRIPLSPLAHIVANWVLGAAQTVIAAWAVHGLGRVMVQYEYVFSDEQKVQMRQVRRRMYGLFWYAFALHMIVWPFSLRWFRITGFIALLATLISVGVLFRHVIHTQLKATRKMLADHELAAKARAVKSTTRTLPIVPSN